MKFAISLVCLAASSCAMSSDPEASTQTSALTDAAESVNWEPEAGCSSGLKLGVVPCDGELIWPADAGIRSVQVLYRKGPDGSNGATSLAFVVWDDTTVGRILRATAGRNVAHLRATINNITAARTSGFPDHNQASAGNFGSGNPPNPPMPHIDEAIRFSQKYLDAAKTAAKTIHAASEQFTAYSE